MIKTENKIVEKALANEITSENINQIFDTEEILEMTNLVHLSNCISIESWLLANADISNVSENYRKSLETKKLEEENLILKTVNKLVETEKVMPKDIREFLALFAIDCLYSDFDGISKKVSAFLGDEKNVGFLENLETDLGFKNPIVAVNMLKAIKAKYTQPDEWYYINLLIFYTKYVSLGLLYVFFED